VVIDGGTADDISVAVSFVWGRTWSVAESWWVSHLLSNVTTSKLPLLWLLGKQVTYSTVSRVMSHHWWFFDNDKNFRQGKLIDYGHDCRQTTTDIETFHWQDRNCNECTL